MLERIHTEVDTDCQWDCCATINKCRIVALWRNPSQLQSNWMYGQPRHQDSEVFGARRPSYLSILSMGQRRWMISQFTNHDHRIITSIILMGSLSWSTSDHWTIGAVTLSSNLLEIPNLYTQSSCRCWSVLFLSCCSASHYLCWYLLKLSL